MAVLSPDYIAWINEKVLEYLPTDKIRTSDKYMFRCPICGDSKKNALKKRGCYYLRNASYYCFNCGVSMTGLKFLSVLSGENSDDIRAEYIRLKYNGKCRKSVGKSQSSGVFSFRPIVKQGWKKPLTDMAREYLEKRKVLEAPFLKDKFYSCTAKDGGEFILIPWIINGIEAYYQINDFTHIDPMGRKYIFPKGHDKLIYGLDNIDMSWPYIIAMEGVYDSLFVPNGIAIGGKSLTDLQRKIIKKRFPGHTIVMSLDNDRPGLIASAREMKKHPEDKMFFFKWFSEDTKEKDINDFVLSKGSVNILADKKSAEACIINPLMMKIFLIKRGLWNAKEINDSDKPKRK